ncbi:3'-5' exonuclease [Bacillus altitudinis]|uniref:3'-5' exonuclease n=1 Tax=Bacillus altitudinis TaxID=293387 RepID=UPI0002E324A4|nr:3'-5' exonuclease [Bacillus altitudinis]QKL23679.1 ATP-dependent helicase [Bacillus altitudinis]QKL27411.1 ATP-dependent helicase [Bacillus altitudinis]QXY97778.1 ATP-dependent helicase [Bacillus altitudinis]
MSEESVKLTKIQKQCVKFKPEGDLLIQGIPGSGKSTILLARACFLSEKNGLDNILLLTFSKALTNYVTQLSMKTNGYPLQAKTFHQWAHELIKETDQPYTRLIFSKDKEKTVRFAKNIINKNGSDVKFPNIKTEQNTDRALIKFLCSEIEWIKGAGITSREEYLGIKRLGRGTDIRVTQDNRQTIYDVLEKYNELLSNHRDHQGIDGDDLARLLIEKADQIPDNMKADHILVDEAQDLHTMQLKAIRTICKTSLTVGADKGQQIYRRNFAWRQSGIDIVGNRSRILKQTFRSTRQIIELANDFQEKDELYVKDHDYHKANVPEIEGLKPELHFCQDSQAEEEMIMNHISKIRSSYPEDTIGIIATSHDRLDKIAENLEKKGIPIYKMKDDEADIVSPGVKLMTYQSSKGLEFDHVIVSDLTKGKLPYKSHNIGDDEEEFLSRERKKLYVAMTRAKKTLTLIAVEEYSPFIKDLNSRLYKANE